MAYCISIMLCGWVDAVEVCELLADCSHRHWIYVKVDVDVDVDIRQYLAYSVKEHMGSTARID